MRLAAVLFVLAAATAHAGVMSTMTSVPPAAGGERKYDPLTLKAGDLKGCLVDAYSIDMADALFEGERPRVEQEREELRKLRDAVAGKPSNAKAAAETELRARSIAFNEHVAALNSRVAYAQDARDRFSKLCKGRRYFADDFSAAWRQLPVEIREAVK
jgi:hypothetical protein